MFCYRTATVVNCCHITKHTSFQNTIFTVDTLQRKKKTKKQVLPNLSIWESVFRNLSFRWTKMLSQCGQRTKMQRKIFKLIRLMGMQPITDPYSTVLLNHNPICSSRSQYPFQDIKHPLNVTLEFKRSQLKLLKAQISDLHVSVQLFVCSREQRRFNKLMRI